MKNKNLLIGAGAVVVVVGYLVWKKSKNKSVVQSPIVEKPLVKTVTDINEIPKDFILFNPEGMSSAVPAFKYTNSKDTTFFKQDMPKGGSIGTPTFITKDEFIKVYNQRLKTLG